MWKLSDENPNLGNYFSTSFFDYNTDEKGLKRYISTLTVSDKERAAIEKYGKLAINLVLHQAKQFGSRQSDALRGIIMASKPSAGYTKESNDFMIDEIRKNTLPLYKYSKEAQKALKGRYDIPFEMEEYQSESEKEKPENIGGNENDPLGIL